MELDDEDITNLLKNLEKAKKNTSQSFNTLCNCCFQMSDYAPLLKQSFPNLEGIYASIIKVQNGRHHMPPPKIFDKWKNYLTNCLTYLKDNQEAILKELTF